MADGSVPGNADTAVAPADAAGGSKDGAADGPARPTGVMAFPGAEGFGADTKGGRGGAIIEVTNLNDSGPGSLRAAVTTKGPRIVVFRVSGTITMASDIEISGQGSYLTIAGQTSPGGIQLKGAGRGLTLSGVHDIVIRHLRIRPGPPIDNDFPTNACITFISGVSNAIIDHVSTGWQHHKQILTYHGARKVTVQWSIVAEGSYPPAYPDSPGAGFIMTQGSQDDELTFHHNLVAHGSSSVHTMGARTMEVRNNVVYDYWGEAGRLGTSDGYHANANLVGNHFIAGPKSDKGHIYYLYNAAGGTKVFTSDNLSPSCLKACANDWTNGFGDADVPDGYKGAKESKYRVMAPFPAPYVTTQPATEVKDAVLAGAGANKPRDSVDTRVVQDVLTSQPSPPPDKSGRGPWPELTGPEPPADRDHDGMSDAWEMAHGLNPDDPKDGPAVAKNGYTNVENYLDELAGDPVPADKP